MFAMAHVFVTAENTRPPPTPATSHFAFGTSALANDALTALVQEHFDLRPGAIIETLGLRNLPQQRGGRFYQDTAAYGHFGRNDLNAPWEDVTAKSQELKQVAAA